MLFGLALLMTLYRRRSFVVSMAVVRSFTRLDYAGFTTGERKLLVMLVQLRQWIESAFMLIPTGVLFAILAVHENTSNSFRRAVTVGCLDHVKFVA